MGVHYPILIFVISVLLPVVGYLVYQRLQPSPARRLLAETASKVETDRRPARELMSVEAVKKIKDFFGLTKDKKKLKEIKILLTQAGYYGPEALHRYLLSKIVVPVSAVILGTLVILPLKISWTIKSMLWYFFLAGGFYLPNFFLKQKTKSRQKKINEGLADALDLMVVCVEAGLGLNAALKRVADDFKISNPVLSQELNLVNLEIMAGLEREQALRNLADRTGVEDIASLVAVLIQADRFGTSIATALRIQSDMMRVKRRQTLEEKAAKTPVKLIFPLLLFIFPALMVVIMGPAIIQMMEKMLNK